MEFDLTGIALAVIGAGALFFLFLNNRKKVAPPLSIPVPSPIPSPVWNLPPEVFPPFLVGEIDFGGQFIIDLRHRVHGCDAGGAPLEETGAYDPDGDLLRYWIEVTGPDRDGRIIPYSVFDRAGHQIDNLWTATNHFPVVRKNRFDPTDLVMEQEAVVYCYAGLNANEPPGGVLIPMSSCPSPIPPLPGPPATVIGEMTVLYKAIDPAGRMRSASARVRVTIASC